MKRGDNVNAAKVCKEAVRVRKIALGSFHQDVAVSLAQLGVAYMETEKHAKAITVFREALRIRRKCLGPMHPKVAKILNNIGCALYELKELEVAKVAFEEALAVQRHNLRETQSDSPEFSDQSLLSIASTLSNLGSIKLYWG
jgi:tetratricopeptide (TPR) repeat protein